MIVKILTVASVCAAGIKPEDLGLKPDMPYFSNINGGTPKITYLHIYECEKFSVTPVYFFKISSVFIYVRFKLLRKM